MLASCENKDKAEAAEFFERANYHFKKREYEKAYQFYSEAIEKVPDFADAYNNRGIILEKQGNIEGAIREYQEAVDLDDSFSKAKINLALAKVQFGETEGIGKLLKSIEQEYRDSSQFHDAMGQYLLANFKSEDAVVSLQKAIALGGENAQLLTNLGYAYYTLKDYEQAKTNLSKVLVTNPDFEFALNNLSATYAQQNDWEKALELSDRLIKLNDKEILFLNTHILNLIETNQLASAKELLVKAAKIAPENVYVQRNQAIVDLKEGKASNALSSLKVLDTSNEAIEYLNYYLALAYAESGDQEKACSYFKKGDFLSDIRSKQEYEKCQ